MKNRTSRLAISAVILACLAPAPAFADALTELRTRLQTIKPVAPYNARIELRTNGITDDDGEQNKFDRAASIEATHDTRGVRLHWTAALLDQARTQKANAQRNPDAPKTGTLASFDANVALDLLDAAPELLLMLEGATLVETRVDTYDNKPASLLVLKPRVSLAKREKKRIKKFESTANLWLDADGWPLAIESQQRVKASMMLISFLADTKEKRTYGHTADRLFVTTSTRDTASEGFGQKSQEHTTTKVTPL